MASKKTKLFSKLNVKLKLDIRLSNKSQLGNELDARILFVCNPLLYSLVFDDRTCSERKVIAHC